MQQVKSLRGFGGGDKLWRQDSRSLPLHIKRCYYTRDEDDGELCFSRKSCGQWVDPGWRRYEEDGLDADDAPEPEPDWAAERLSRTTGNDHDDWYGKWHGSLTEVDILDIAKPARRRGECASRLAANSPT